VFDFHWRTRQEPVIAIVAIVASVVAVWLTLRADFLAYPGWLAAQKADMILGPVVCGLYWLRRRPGSRFGPVMIAVGLLTVPYLLQSWAAPWAFGIGVVWEGVIFVTTLALILAFPAGRLDRWPERAILVAAVLGVVVPSVVTWMLAPQITAGATISSCAGACPPNALLISSHPELAVDLSRAVRVVIATLDLATMALIAWRFATGSPPRRRALAIGTPIALIFLGTQFAHQVVQVLSLDAGTLDSVVRWAYVIARAALWYGFIFALVAAELFAGRVLRRIVQESLRRPSLRELEGMLRGPLGDPDLRLAFWRAASRDWVDGDGAPVEPSGDRILTAVERDGRPAAAIVHDPQLAEDPELVQAAGAVALLAEENARLELAWTNSLRHLRESRARIAAAGENERRALERDLHDGAQQQLTAVMVKLALVGELLPQGSVAQVRLAALESELEEAQHALRRLGHGIYPSSLAEAGIVGALTTIATRSGGAIDVDGDGIGRYRPEIEAAVYYCCLEAVQNAIKHAGPGAGVTITVREVGTELCFEVRDDGPGFDTAAAHGGVGLRNMRDRIDALHGRLEVTASPGRGTLVAGSVPIS
jgi:signal transduction histidine kinase